MLELLILDRIQIDRIDHLFRDAKLLIDAREHDLFVNRLIFAPDEIAIGIHIKVDHGLHVRERHVNEDVVNIEAVVRKLKADLLQKRRAVDDRMHQEILR